MEQLFFAGKAYLKINSLVKTPLHEFMAVERSGLWAPGLGISLSASFFFIVPHRSGSGECSQGHSRAWVQLVVVRSMHHIQGSSPHKS